MIRLRAACLVFCLVVCPVLAQALALQMPAQARQTAEHISEFDSYELPAGPFAQGAVPAEPLKGRITRRAWRVDSAAANSLQIFDMLRQQLAQAGFDVSFECQADACGGFDFRFGIDVLPAPDMHVDIRDYRYLSARRGDTQAVSLIVSKLRDAAFIQLTLVEMSDLKSDLEPVQVTPAPMLKEAVPTQEMEKSLSQKLLSVGHVTLDDLAFASGGSNLEEREYASLQALAAFLAEVEEGVIVLVGHTDTTGAIEANIRLSKRRAQSVRNRLIGSYNVDPARLEAEGNGYLSPIASNLTEAGRKANRRVEAVLKP